MRPQEVREIAQSDKLLEIGRREIQSTLKEFRDGRISLIGRGNGLVIREANGKDSHVIRLGPEDALRIGLNAIADYLDSVEAEVGDGEP